MILLVLWQALLKRRQSAWIWGCVGAWIWRDGGGARICIRSRGLVLLGLFAGFLCPPGRHSGEDIAGIGWSRRYGRLGLRINRSCLVKVSATRERKSIAAIAEEIADRICEWVRVLVDLRLTVGIDLRG